MPSKMKEREGEGKEREGWSKEKLKGKGGCGVPGDHNLGVEYEGHTSQASGDEAEDSLSLHSDF